MEVEDGAEQNTLKRKERIRRRGRKRDEKKRRKGEAE
jgi:hypothetical protein